MHMLHERHNKEAVYIVSSPAQLSGIDRVQLIQIALKHTSEDLESF